MICTNCGQPNKENAKFCTNCGQKLLNIEGTIQKKKDKEDFSIYVKEEDKDTLEDNLKKKNINKAIPIALGLTLGFIVIGFGAYKITLESIKSNAESVEIKSSNQGTKPSENNKEEEKKKESTNNEYILKESNTKNLSREDLKNLSKKDLSIARNEIFARHGYVSKNQEYKDYFSSKSWYKENPTYNGNQNILNEYEKANLRLIESLEKN